MTDFSTITACGECCVGCSKKIDGLCPGCIEADGHVPEWAQSGMCKVHACCKEHNARFCGLCSEFPCDKLPQLISWNPDIIQHLSALQDEYIINGLSGEYAVRRLAEEDIPEILAVVGAILNVIVSGPSVNSVVFGAFSGMASTGFHQSFKAFVEGRKSTDDPGEEEN